jgi:AhpD family alkylhydroperoxidase
MTKRKFLRRTYHSLDEFLVDFRFIWSNRPLIRKAMRSLIPLDFRERLMLVVTEVNGCRYCSYGHSMAALKAGVPQEQIDVLSKGSIPVGAPHEEKVALLYAQHWAENDARPNPEAVKQLLESYGKEKAQAINLLLRMIRVGNLLGNSGDYLLFRLSFWLLGVRKDEARFSVS